MKVLQINAVYGIMSTGRSAKQTADFLRANGHKCITFYGEHSGSYDDAIFMGNAFTHRIHTLTARLSGDAGIGSYAATKQLLTFIDDYKPDIVHLRNLHGNYVHIPMLLRYLATKDIPTVVSLHDCFFFTGGCMHYTSNQCLKWLDKCENCAYMNRGKNYIFTNRASHNLQRKKELFSAIPRLAVCGVSEWTEREARRSPVFAKAKIITHVYNWIDLGIFKPLTKEENAETKNELGTREQPMILGVASEWGKAKGLDDFNKLARLMPNKKVVLVGKMPENVVLAPNIIAAGSTESVGKLAKLYSAADVFVHLSIEETFGKVTAEALACGTPAIVYNSTASPELISAETGIAVTPGDIAAVGNAVNQILSRPEASKNCRERAERLFDMDKNICRQLEMYIDLINTKSHGNDHFARPR